MRYILIPYEVEAVQLIVYTSKNHWEAISKWSSSPEWFTDLIKRKGIYFDTQRCSIKIGNENDSHNDNNVVFEGDWLINEVDKGIQDIYIVRHEHFKEHFKVVKEVTFEENLKVVYTHKFE